MLKSLAHLLRLLILLPALSFALPCSAASSNDRPTPVTDKRLRNLHLDGRYHKCIAVADGDTLTLDGLGTVRFIGVDTPEKNHPKLPVQFMSAESTAFTKNLCMGKNIRLEYDPHDEDKRGNYGRVLGYLYLEDGTFIQEQLLKNGYASAYTRYPFDEKRKDQFLAWERTARQKKLGIWRQNAMGEVLWNLGRRQLMIQVERVPLNRYRLRIGTWISKPFHHGEIALNLVNLYTTAHELGPLDLRKQLRQSGYTQSVAPEPFAVAVMVMGMAHRKWGIIYGNHAKPRVQAEDLDRQIQALCGRKKDLDAEHLEVMLSKNGYGPVPENLIRTIDPLKIADGFLKTEPAARNKGRTISWESAGKYIGKKVSVEGKIVRSHNSGTACFLNFHRNFTRYMSLVIFENNFRKFPFQPEKFYLNKTVRVRGKIKEYEGKPEIVLENPRQIEVIKSR